MITELTDQEVITLGARYRADYLLEQSGYTIGLAAQEDKALADYLPAGYLAEVTSARDAVAAAAQDKSLQQAEAKEATRVHHTAFGDAKVWRRKAARIAACAKHLGKPIPDALLHISQARTAPALALQVTNMVKLLDANQASLPGTGAAALIEEGKTLAAALQTADDAKELKRYAALPGAVQDFYRQKGLLYLGLKVINGAAQALHAGDPVAASRYAMTILYRRGRAHAAQPAPAPQPAPRPAVEPELVKA